MKVKRGQDYINPRNNFVTNFDRQLSRKSKYLSANKRMMEPLPDKPVEPAGVLRSNLNPEDYNRVTELRTAKCLRKNIKLAKLLRGELTIAESDTAEEAYENVIKR